MVSTSSVGDLLLSLLSCLLVLLGQGSGVRVPGPSPSLGTVRIMPLGDSITDGLDVPGSYRTELWRRLRSEGHPVDFVGSRANGPAALGDHDHEGHPGWTIDAVQGRIVSWLRSADPRVVLLHLGTNDMPQDAAGAPARMSRLIGTIVSTSPRVHLYVSTLVPSRRVDPAVRNYNRVLSGIVLAAAEENRRIHLVRMYEALSIDDLLDTTHPTRAGYAKMAAIWDGALRSFWQGTSAGPTAGPGTAVGGSDRASWPAPARTRYPWGRAGCILSDAISPVVASAAAGQNRPSVDEYRTMSRPRAADRTPTCRRRPNGLPRGSHPAPAAIAGTAA
jgi:lysophospholipase L1-like esterase